jgi:hypothetical protein
MLMITKLDMPSGTVTQDWYVHCKRPQTPAKVEDVVQDIVRYATYPVGAYWKDPKTGSVEYLVGFEAAGFTLPQFYTIDKLRQIVRNLLHPYHRIDTS